MEKLLVLGFFCLTLGGCGQTVEEKTESMVEAKPTEEAVVKYGMGEVEKHNMKGDCWMVVEGKIYDISIHPEHPGGNVIFEGCGKDASELFKTKAGKGKEHSGDAQQQLVEFYIGDLNG